VTNWSKPSSSMVVLGGRSVACEAKEEGGRETIFVRTRTAVFLLLRGERVRRRLVFNTTRKGEGERGKFSLVLEGPSYL